MENVLISFNLKILGEIVTHIQKSLQPATEEFCSKKFLQTAKEKAWRTFRPQRLFCNKTDENLTIYFRFNQVCSECQHTSIPDSVLQKLI